MNKKQKIQQRSEEPLRLMRWVMDGCPPIDFNSTASDILKMANEITRLRKRKEELEVMFIGLKQTLIEAHVKHLQDQTKLIETQIMLMQELNKRNPI